MTIKIVDWLTPIILSWWNIQCTGLFNCHIESNLKINNDNDTNAKCVFGMEKLTHEESGHEIIYHQPN